ncbi:hypothetical protein FQR65_LT20506 [Abscondita terminalis]|nr:hypothetical protein FQR65_LT20506 [Abscondita terminalis]
MAPWPPLPWTVILKSLLEAITRPLLTAMFARGQCGPVVHAEDGIHGKASNSPSFDQSRARPAAALLGGEKDFRYSVAVEIALPRADAGPPPAACRVPSCRRHAFLPAAGWRAPKLLDSCIGSASMSAAGATARPQAPPRAVHDCSPRGWCPLPRVGGAHLLTNTQVRVRRGCRAPAPSNASCAWVTMESMSFMGLGPFSVIWCDIHCAPFPYGDPTCPTAHARNNLPLSAPAATTALIPARSPPPCVKRHRHQGERAKPRSPAHPAACWRQEIRQASAPKAASNLRPWPEADLADISARLHATAQRNPESVLPYNYAGTMGLGAKAKAWRRACSTSSVASLWDRTSICASADRQEALCAHYGGKLGMRTSALCREAGLTPHLGYGQQQHRQQPAFLALCAGGQAQRRTPAGWRSCASGRCNGPPERAAQVCGLPPAQIRQLAREYGSTRPARHPPELTAAAAPTAGAMRLRAVACLPALMLGRGGRCGHAELQMPNCWARAAAAPSTWCRSAMHCCTGVGGDFGPRSRPCLSTTAPGGGRARVRQGGAAALRAEDLFTGARPLHADTADHADYVAAGHHATGSTGNIHASYATRTCCSTARPIAPLGQARSNARISSRPGERSSPRHDAHSAAPRISRMTTKPCAARPWMRNAGSISKQLLQHGFCDSATGPRRLLADGGFPTPSGRCEFHSERLARRGLDPPARPCAQYEPPDPAGRYPAGDDLAAGTQFSELGPSSNVKSPAQCRGPPPAGKYTRRRRAAPHCARRHGARVQSAVAEHCAMPASTPRAPGRGGGPGYLVAQGWPGTQQRQPAHQQRLTDWAARHLLTVV